MYLKYTKMMIVLWCRRKSKNLISHIPNSFAHFTTITHIVSCWKRYVLYIQNSFGILCDHSMYFIRINTKFNYYNSYCCNNETNNLANKTTPFSNRSNCYKATLYFVAVNWMAYGTETQDNTDMYILGFLFPTFC